MIIRVTPFTTGERFSLKAYRELGHQVTEEMRAAITPGQPTESGRSRRRRARRRSARSSRRTSACRCLRWALAIEGWCLKCGPPAPGEKQPLTKLERAMRDLDEAALFGPPTRPPVRTPPART